MIFFSFRSVCETEIVAGGNLLSLFTPAIIEVCLNPNKYPDINLRASASLALTKFMLVSSEFCDEQLQLLFTVLEVNMIWDQIFFEYLIFFFIILKDFLKKSKTPNKKGQFLNCKFSKKYSKRIDNPDIPLFYIKAQILYFFLSKLYITQYYWYSTIA